MDVDAAVFGTGLSESVAAAALSKAGFSVVHIDANAYYGGNDASLTFDELIQWAHERTTPSEDKEPTYISVQKQRYTSISRSSETLPQSRQYSFSLSPTVIPSLGPLIDSLVTSGVSRYGGFKLLERLGMFDRPGVVRSVPSSKEDVFKSRELSLVDKRRLMRFLVFAAGQFEGTMELTGRENTPFFGFLRDIFSLDERTASSVAFGLALCVSVQDPTLPALQRLRRYSKSVGRYGPSAFLVGHYGGVGEVAQGFCRTSAVSGGTYILGRRLLSITQLPSQGRTEKFKEVGRKYAIELEEFPERLTCDMIISSPDYIPSELSSHASAVPPPLSSTSGTPTDMYPVARCIAVIDSPIRFLATGPSPETRTSGDTSSDEQAPQEKGATGEVDTAMLIFAPSSVSGGSTTSAAHMLVTGEGSMSAPSGRWIVYLSRHLLHEDEKTSSAEELLKPYLNATMSLIAPSISEEGSALPIQPIFTLFFIQNPLSAPPASDAASTILVPPPVTSLVSELADAATENAEQVFWKAAQTITSARAERKPQGGEGKGETPKDIEVDSFWPPLDVIDDEPTLEEW
ncbi:hypothetical protein CERSUDRAFT_119383 [Gelatoporia subvermispora B]|uniref:Rab proteins geranylgeranyltransferase n=1 Tax=Ceriporiopsis subvermispora (strain B) TaxID=914234 RepID=M2QZ46_CERS8|nr:hypothetical protein CERSUDRAFT_119383 [Gelatoporia subvermispora B]